MRMEPLGWLEVLPPHMLENANKSRIPSGYFLPMLRITVVSVLSMLLETFRCDAKSF